MSLHPNEVGSGSIDIPVAQLNITPSSLWIWCRTSVTSAMRVYLSRSVLVCNEKLGQAFIDKD